MKRVFRAFENWIDPFRGSPTQDLPEELGQFIVFFLKQARWPFFAFLIVGGIVGLVEASLFYFVGLLIDTCIESLIDSLI